MNAASAVTFIGTMNGVITPVAIIFEPCRQRAHQRHGEEVVDRSPSRARRNSATNSTSDRAHRAHQPLAQLDQVGDEAFLLLAHAGLASALQAWFFGGRLVGGLATSALFSSSAILFSSVSVLLTSLVHVALEVRRRLLHRVAHLAQLLELDLAVDVGLDVGHVALQLARRGGRRCAPRAAASRGRSRSAPPRRSPAAPRILCRTWSDPREQKGARTGAFVASRAGRSGLLLGLALDFAFDRLAVT